MRKLSVVLFIITAVLNPSFGQQAETGGLPGEYLNSFSVSGRAAGMGMAAIAASDDAYGAYFNPAGLAFLTHSYAGFSVLKMAETQYGFIGCAVPLDLESTLGIARFGFDSPLAEKTNSLGESLGYFQEKESVYLLSYARKMSDNLRLGVNLKVLFQEIDVYSAFGIGLDAGVIFVPTEDLKLGAVLQNILPASLKLKDETDRYPVNLKIGGGYLLKDTGLLITADLGLMDILSFYRTAVRWGAGVEYHLKYWQDVFLRCGINYKEFTAGAGVEFSNIGFDYAVGVSALDLKHTVSLTLKFGMPLSGQEKALLEEKKKLQVERAVTKSLANAEGFFKDGNFAEAKKEAQQVSLLDPLNSDYKAILEKINKVVYGKEADEHYRAALRYSDEDSFDLAEEEFKKTLELNPAHAEAKEYQHYNQARKNMADKKYNEAEEELKVVLKLNPANTKAKEALRRLLDVLDLLK